MVFIVYCDGLCEPKNPGGIATYGFVLYKDDIKLYEGKGLVGEGPAMSNNVAEYAALCNALNFLKEEKLTDEKVIVRSDSRLLVNQMSGEWKVRRGLYISKYNEARKLNIYFRDITYEWIPRESNEEADALSQRVYHDYLRTGESSQLHS